MKIKPQKYLPATVAPLIPWKISTWTCPKGLGAFPGHMSGAEGSSHAAKKCQIYERLAKQI